MGGTVPQGGIAGGAVLALRLPEARLPAGYVSATLLQHRTRNRPYVSRAQIDCPVILLKS
jgi:hypothetical protein